MSGKGNNSARQNTAPALNYEVKRISSFGLEPFASLVFDFQSPAPFVPPSPAAVTNATATPSSSTPKTSSPSAILDRRNSVYSTSTTPPTDPKIVHFAPLPTGLTPPPIKRNPSMIATPTETAIKSTTQPLQPVLQNTSNYTTTGSAESTPGGSAAQRLTSSSTISTSLSSSPVRAVPLATTPTARISDLQKPTPLLGSPGRSSNDPRSPAVASTPPIALASAPVASAGASPKTGTANGSPVKMSTPARDLSADSMWAAVAYDLSADAPSSRTLSTTPSTVVSPSKPSVTVNAPPSFSANMRSPSVARSPDPKSAPSPNTPNSSQFYNKPPSLLAPSPSLPMLRVPGRNSFSPPAFTRSASAMTSPSSTMNSSPSASAFQSFDSSPTGLKYFAESHFYLPRRGLFRRKVKLTKILEYQRGALKSPLLLATKLAALETEAIESFDSIQTIMAARGEPADQPQLGKIQTLLATGIRLKPLRDEIYLQLFKQVHKNPDVDSAVKGWRMLCAVVNTFPPSKAIDAYVNDFLGKQSKATGMLRDDGRVEAMALYCFARLPKICKTGAIGKAPALIEVERSLNAAFSKSVFGRNLDEVMEMQAEQFPTDQIPHIILFLTLSIVELGGISTEGLFRVPGDADAVTELRCSIDKGIYSVGKIVDANVPASMLKLWMRELSDPIIPIVNYDECIEVGRNFSHNNYAMCYQTAMGIIDSLAPINRRVAVFIVEFLREISNYSAKTKMPVQNLAMVFAPNFLRCPSENLTLVLENSKHEQSFLRILIGGPNNKE